MTTQKLKFPASFITILGMLVPRVHQSRKFDSRCLLNQTAPTAA